MEQYTNDPYSFVHYSDLDKLGINPKSDFNTPLGIYAYPANQFDADTLLNGRVPFAGNREYLHVFQVKPEYRENIIFVRPDGSTNKDKHFQEYIQNEMAQDESSANKLNSELAKGKQFIQSFLSKFRKEMNSAFSDPATKQSLLSMIGKDMEKLENILGATKQYNKDWFKLGGSGFGMMRSINFPTFAKQFLGEEAYSSLDKTLQEMYNLLDEGSSSSDDISFYISNKKEDVLNSTFKKTPFGYFWNISRSIVSGMKEWRSYMVKNGIFGVVDYGAGIIHENEPNQAVFYSKEYIEHVNTFRTRQVDAKQETIEPLVEKANQKMSHMRIDTTFSFCLSELTIPYPYKREVKNILYQEPHVLSKIEEIVVSLIPGMNPHLFRINLTGAEDSDRTNLDISSVGFSEYTNDYHFKEEYIDIIKKIDENSQIVGSAVAKFLEKRYGK